MAKEVGSRDLAAASGVTSNKALDALLNKKHLLDEVDQAKAELQAVSGEQVASADADQVAAATDQVATTEGAAAEGDVIAVVADSGIIMTDAVSVAGAAGAGGLSTNTLLLIGGGTLVGGTAIALSSDGGNGGGDGGNGGPGGNGGDGSGGVIVDPNPGTNDAPLLTLVSEQVHTENTLLVAKFSAIDPDANVNQTSKIVLSGADAALFTITDGTLQFIKAPDFEAPLDVGKDNVYNVTLTVADAEGDATKSTTYNYSFEVKNDNTSVGEKPGDPTAGADTFTLSDNDVGQNGPDNASLLGGDDKFIAAVGDLDNQDNLNGGDGTDTLTATIGKGEDQTPTLTSIEIINVESRGPEANSLNLFNATGVTTVNVIDNGDANGPLLIKNLDTSTLVNLKGDQDVSIGLKDSSGDADVVKTGVNGFTGDLILTNAIETLTISADGKSDFGLKDPGAALEKVVLTGAADITLTSYGATEYDWSLATGNDNLNFVAANPDAVVVKFGSGNNTVDFNTFIKSISSGPDVVDGGAGLDTVIADLNTGPTVEPTISNVEKISLAFLAPAVGGPDDTEFDASHVSNTPVFEIRESEAYVNVNEIQNGSNIDIVGDIDNDGEGATFDFRSGTKATTLISLVTTSEEGLNLLITGDLEVNDVANLTVRVGEKGSAFDSKGDGSVLTGGEAEITGAIALDDDFTTDLTIGTTEEDDDDADNDGDLTVDGAAFGVKIVDLLGQGQIFPVGSAISQSDALENLTINGLNGNIFLGDGQVATGDYAIEDATSLETLTVVANNATVALGNIGFSNGLGAVIGLLAGLNGNEDQASNLDEVNITGVNRGIFNLDDINAGDLVGGNTGNQLNGQLGAGLPISVTLNGANIEHFNVTTAERSETKNTFTEDSTPFGFNQIENTVANVIEDLRIDVAEDGRLMWGDIYSNLNDVTITGDGRLDLFNNNSGVAAGNIPIFDEDDGARLVDDGAKDELGLLPIHNSLFALYFVRDIDATGHTGPLELDFRTFVGTNVGVTGNLLNAFDLGIVAAVQNGLFDGQPEVDATIRIGDQDLIDNGIRFDSYGLVGWILSESDLESNFGLDGASVTVVAGNGDHHFDRDGSDNFLNGAVSGDTDLGVALYGLDLNGTTYGIVTGFGDDHVTTGSGDSDIFTGVGDDVISAGKGEDLVRGGFGQDTIDLGNDTVTDTLQFVGHILDGQPQQSGETMDDNFDRITNFHSQQDVVELWNYFVLPAATDPEDNVVAMPHFNFANPDGGLPLQQFLTGASVPDGTFIVEFTGEYLNGDLKSANVEDELLESQLASDFFNNIKTTDDFFAIVWDEGHDDAALFFIADNGDADAPISAADVHLVAVFENVPENGFGFGDFQVGYAP